ncbi:MAG TPA: hypothetical protein VJZ76_14605 [Thermoanaerobaculia bacterium]|nr:hypothetical protein [Thermoanaerobaculia bacterium]
MNDDTCPFEPNVIDAAASGQWTESLRAHAASCPDCAAAAEVAPWMVSFAKHDDREHILPDPSVLWLKAKLLGTAAAVERASLPITRVQIAAYLIIAAGWATLLTWKWTALMAWLEALNPGRIATGPAGPAGAATLSMTVLVTLVLLASATVMVAFHAILAEE